MKQDTYAVTYLECGLDNPKVWIFTDHEAMQRYYVAFVLALINNFCRMNGSYDGVEGGELSLAVDMMGANTTEERSMLCDRARMLMKDWFPDDMLHAARVSDTPWNGKSLTVE